MTEPQGSGTVRPEPVQPKPVQPEPVQPEPSQNLPQPYVPPAGPSALQRYQRPAFDEPGEDTISLESYLQILLRRKWLLLSAALTVLFLVALQVFTATPIYQATTTLQIDPEDQKVLPYESVESGSVGSGNLEGYLWTQAEKLQARGLARRVVNKLSLADHEAFTEPARKGVLIDLAVGARKLASSLIVGSRDENQGDDRQLIADFLERLAVRPLRNTRLIKISFESPDPELAAEVTNTLSEEFIEQHLEGKFQATARAAEFLERQLEGLQIMVEESEQALLRYARQQNIVNLSERDTISRKRLADLSDELTRVETAYLSEQARYSATRAATLESFPEVLKTDAMHDLEERLSTLEGELSGLSIVYGPALPKVRTLRSEIAGLGAQLDDQKRRALSSARQGAALAAGRVGNLEAAVARQRELVDELNEDSIQYNILKRESEGNKEIYEGLLQRLKEAGVAAGLRSSNIQVADPASVPRFATSPKKARSLALALVLGLFLGTGLAFAVDTFDSSLKGSDDVTQTLGLPSLGVVPRVEFAGASRRWAIPGPGKSQPPSPFLVFGNEEIRGKHRVIEAYRLLRTSILLSHSGKPPQVILVTSALPGEGKTTTAINAAISLARTGARTLVMDLDMRKPAMAPTLKVSSEQGMSSYLSGHSDLSSQIKSTSFVNLFALPAGPRAPNPAEFIGSKRMRAGLELMREYFTYVVIDTPPVLEISDALILSPAVDGVILVARAGKTPRKAVDRGATQILAVGGTLLGVLLNGVDLNQPGYGSYYGSYGGYYGRQVEDNPKKTA